MPTKEELKTSSTIIRKCKKDEENKVRSFLVEVVGHLKSDTMLYCNQEGRVYITTKNTLESIAGILGAEDSANGFHKLVLLNVYAGELTASFYPSLHLAYATPFLTLDWEKVVEKSIVINSIALEKFVREKVLSKKAFREPPSNKTGLYLIIAMLNDIQVPVGWGKLAKGRLIPWKTPSTFLRK